MSALGIVWGQCGPNLFLIWVWFEDGLGVLWVWFAKEQGLLGARHIKLKDLMQRDSHKRNVFRPVC